MIRILALLAALLLAACPAPTPLVPPSPDASDAAPPPVDADGELDAAGSPYARACARLAALGCPEGADQRACVDAFAAAQGRFADFQPACVVSASSPATLRARCGPSWTKGCAGR